MVGSWSLVLDAAVFGDEELRFPDSADARFEFLQVGGDALRRDTQMVCPVESVARGDAS